jgi:hypothetical protein
VTTLAEPPPTTTSRPVAQPGEVARRSRWPVLMGAVVLLVAVLITLLTGAVSVGRLDPDATSPDGARAVANVLRSYGVEVRRVPGPAPRAGVTTVVAAPDLVDPDQVANAVAAGAGDVVVLEPTAEVLRAVRSRAGLEVRTTGAGDSVERAPGCDLDAATTAGRARVGGRRFRADDADFRCYSVGGDPTLVVYTDGARQVAFVGSADGFTNQRLDEEGNAALAVRLLGRTGAVDWVYPRIDELPGVEAQRPDVLELFPTRLRWAILQAVVAVALLMLWRARRLGPVVTEPLPVVVRAAEAVEGRARLYEQGRASVGAGETLRAASRARLTRLLGLGPEPSRAVLVAAVAARVRRGPAGVESALYGAPALDDELLVRLAAELDDLEREVRQT